MWHANLLLSAKYGRLIKEYSDSPSQQSIPLSQLAQAPVLQDQVNQGRPAFEVVFKEVEGNADDDGNRRTRIYWHFLCYFLHAFLVVLHLILLVIAASHHPEHSIVVPGQYAEMWITGLSVGLQAFYTVSYAVTTPSTILEN